MVVTGKRRWYIAALVLGQEFICHRIEWNGEIAAQLVSLEKSFWEENVLAGTVPEPDGTEACDKIIQEYFGHERKESSIELVVFDEKLERREEIVAQMKELEREQKQIDQEIKLFMQENERATNGKYRISWGNVQSTRLDAARMKQERPDIYADYSKTSSTRRFEVRAA